ncbi:MAG: hypothetical protein M3314_00360, partial [Actinomycetota bacterium]|nr:hypothetical protein [Actinomycetota bacterium]
MTPEYPVADPARGAARFDQSEAAVASNGDGYLVAWTSWLNTARGRLGSIRAARVDAGGVPVDQFGFPVSTGGSGASAPSVAWNNGVYLVVWEQDIPEQTFPCCFPDLVADVYGARIASDGTVLDPEGFAIATGTGSHQDAATVAPLGDGFVVAFRDRRPDRPGIRAARVRPDGTVMDPDGLDVAVG